LPNFPIPRDPDKQGIFARSTEPDFALRQFRLSHAVPSSPYGYFKSSRANPRPLLISAHQEIVFFVDFF
jgi:hypothetical protein